MNTLRCPTCDEPMAYLYTGGSACILLCVRCDHTEPLPPDQQLRAQRAPRLKGL